MPKLSLPVIIYLLFCVLHDAGVQLHRYRLLL